MYIFISTYQLSQFAKVYGAVQMDEWNNIKTRMILNLYLTINVLIINFVMTISECNYNGLVFDTKYDSATAPPFGYESVESKLKLLKISSVDDSHTTMTLVLKIYLNWKEPRIQIAGNSEEKILLRLSKDD